METQEIWVYLERVNSYVEYIALYTVYNEDTDVIKIWKYIGLFGLRNKQTAFITFQG